jgi:hypothetical protein
MSPGVEVARWVQEGYCWRLQGCDSLGDGVCDQWCSIPASFLLVEGIIGPVEKFGQMGEGGGNPSFLR